MIETYKGHWLNPFDPDPACINIFDIAHALSLAPRFAGHTRTLYSVAEHSVKVVYILRAQSETPQIQLQGLLHDASEAYLCDIPSPIKREMPEYAEIEARLQTAIFAKFGVPTVMDPNVKLADGDCLRWDMMVTRYTGGQWTSAEAKSEFLAVYADLIRKRQQAKDAIQ